jgi:hypothetical protein
MTSKLNKRRVGSILGSAFALMFVVAIMAPGSAQGQLALGQNVRWDLIQVLPAGAPNTAIPGGTDMGHDAATGDTVALTGSGGAIPALGDATGGGTFVHIHNGSVFAQGFYVVTGFVSWVRRAGTFPLPNDGVGHVAQASAGLLTLNIRAFPSGGSPVDGVLVIHCHFPDTPGTPDEGIELTVTAGGTTFHFTQAGGVTLFHVFR